MGAEHTLGPTLRPWFGGLPFLFCADPRWGLPVVALMTGDVHGLYAWLCGDLALGGAWDFVGQPRWPMGLRVLRDACVLGLVAFAAAQASRAVRALSRR